MFLELIAAGELLAICMMVQCFPRVLCRLRMPVGWALSIVVSRYRATSVTTVAIEQLLECGMMVVQAVLEN